jgi:hypothetical protein
MDYLAHWVIGVVALAIWAFGKQWGMEASLIAFAAYTLPIIVGHAISKSQNKDPITPIAPDVTPIKHNPPVS